MERFIHDDRTGLDYELVGDCYLIAGEDLGFYRKPEKNRISTMTPFGGRSMWYDPLKTGMFLREYSLNVLTIPLKSHKK